MPEWKSEIRRRLASLRLDPIREEGIVEELAGHLEDRYAELVSGGATPKEALRSARAELSESELLQQELRRLEPVSRRVATEPIELGANRTSNMIADLWQDLRYGLRMLRKSPGFTAVAVVSLALGIGANTAIFSLIETVMLRTLPVKDPKHLEVFSIVGQGTTRYSFNYPLFERLREDNQSFTGITAASTPVRMRMLVTDQSTNGLAESVQATKVSGNFFSVLGVDAVAGRTFTEDDDKASSLEPVVIISSDFWKRRFGQDQEVVGKKITLNDFPFTIIGVAPPGFFGFEVGRRPDLWCPIQVMAQLEGGSVLKQSGAWWLRLIGRLRPELSASQARDEADVVLKQQVAETLAERPGMLESVRNSFLSMRIELEDGRSGWTGLRQQFRQPLFILLTITGLVLLVACANVANLLLARAASRQKEIAVRLALGAGRSRLIRQLLTEGVLLAILGGIAGLLFAQWGTRLMLAYLPPQQVDGLHLNPDARILGFTLAVSVVTGILFGLMPALKTTRLDLIASLRNQSGSHASRSRLALNRALVIAQVALSLFLLIGSGLFVRSLQNLKNIDAGFDRENLTQFVIDYGKDYKLPQRLNLYKQVLARLEALPGTRSATLSNFSLLSGNRIYNKVVVPGYTSQNEDEALCNMLYVGPKYFETMGMRLLEGRDFNPRDERNLTTNDGNQAQANAAKDASSNGPLFVLISETMAEHFFAGENPLGKRFSYEAPAQKNTWFEVIGVVSNAKYMSLREPMPKTFYVSYFQSPQGGTTIQLRTTGQSPGLAESIRSIVQDIDPRLQVVDLTTVSDIVNDSMIQERFIAQLAGFFSLFALSLACVGLYGVMSYTVTRRTNEIGIRMALGARSQDVVGLVMWETMRMVAIGVIVGLSVALVATRLISSLLFGLTPTDPVTISVAILLMFAVAALAGYLPAKRASQVDPMVALRCD